MDETNMIYGRASVELLVSWSWGECGELVETTPLGLQWRRVQVTSWTKSRDGYSYAPVDGLGSKGWTHLSCFRNFQRVQ